MIEISPNAKQIFIQGITEDGKVFRPSDWAERLAGVMSQFRPGGQVSGRLLGYSPWCTPTVIGELRCIVLDIEMRDAEPMAWSFVMNFAKDNKLQIAEACLLDPQ